MNKPPIDDLPPNSLHSQQSKFGELVPPGNNDISSSSDVDFTISAFEKILTKNIRIKHIDPMLQSDKISHQIFIHNASPSSSVGKSSNFGQLPKNCKPELRGSCTTAVNGNPVFDKALIINKFEKV